MVGVHTKVEAPASALQRFVVDEQRDLADLAVRIDRIDVHLHRLPRAHERIIERHAHARRLGRIRAIGHERGIEHQVVLQVVLELMHFDRQHVAACAQHLRRQPHGEECASSAAPETGFNTCLSKFARCTSRPLR